MEGELRQRKWTDRDGVNRETYEIFCTNFQFLTPKSAVYEQPQVEHPYEETTTQEIIDEDFFKSNIDSTDIDDIWSESKSGFEDISDDDTPPF